MSWLQCGCCGREYEVKGRVRSQFDQDDGYGTCPGCKQDEVTRNEEEWVKIENVMAGALNPENAKKFRALEMEVRRGLILKAMDDGILTWTIERAA